MRIMPIVVAFWSLLSLSITASADGNFAGREIGDVMYRGLDINLNDHTGIYIGQTNKNCDPTNATCHQLVQMTGILPRGKSGLLVGKVENIAYENLDAFERAHPGYYGAFTHPDSLGMEVRKAVLRKAQELQNRYSEIKYIVQEGDIILGLRNYFEYESSSGGLISTDDITRMRCDAFVEYCYASAFRPIMDEDITLKSGAKALIARAERLLLWPSSQKARLVAAQVDSPVLKIYAEDGTLASDFVNITAKLKADIEDVSSGPGLLSMQSGTGEYFDGVSQRVSFPLNPDKENYVDAISSAQVVQLSTKAELTAGYTSYGFVAYDHAGNSSNAVSFTIPQNVKIQIHSLLPLYEWFGGVSSAIPSTLERDHSFNFSGNISSVTIDGPQGNILNWSFDPPVVSTSVAFVDMSPGYYQVTAINSVGAVSNSPFRIVDMSISISTTGTSQTYTQTGLYSSGTFNFVGNFNLSSQNQFKTVQLMSSAPVLLEGKSIGTEAADVNFDFSAIQFPILNTTEAILLSRYYSNLYIIRGFDSLGTPFIKGLNVTIPRRNLAEGPSNSINSYVEVSTGDILDLGILPGAVVSNYSLSEPSLSIGTSTSVGYSQVLVGTAYEADSYTVIGQASVIFRTWNNPDKSDVVETSLLDSTIYIGRDPETLEYSFKTTNGNGVPKRITIKRYYEIEKTYTKASNTLLHGLYAAEVSIAAGLKVTGVSLQLTLPGWFPNVIPMGENIVAPLNSYGEIKFSSVSQPGYCPSAIINGRPPAGFAQAPLNSVYSIEEGDVVVGFDEPATLTLKYDPSTLTSSQKSNLKIIKILDAAAGKYQEFDTTSTENTVSAEVSSLPGQYMIAVPEFSVVQKVETSNLVSGSPEFELLSGEAVSQSEYALSSSTGQAILAQIKSADKIPVGNVYQIAGSTLSFEPSAAIKMRYSDSSVASLGVAENSLAIYAFSDDGSLYQLPYRTIDTDNNVLTARVPSADAYPLFAVLASSQQAENIPPAVYPDGISPETSIGFDGISTDTVDGTYISSNTKVVFTSSDPVVATVETSGVGYINYVLFPESESVSLSTYTAPFQLPEGVYPLYYLSADNAGNYEFPKATTIYVDATPPVTTLSAPFLEVSSWTTSYLNVAGPISLVPSDQNSNGVASGLLGSIYLVDSDIQDCPNLSQFLSDPLNQQLGQTGEPGTCSNPVYSGEFALSTGTHAIQYLSLDRVFNIEEAKTVYLNVLEGDSVPPEVGLLVNGSTITVAEYPVSASAEITVSATDPISSGVTSGVDAIYYLVDVNPQDCGDMEDIVSTAPHGTCLNPVYEDAFNLPIGTHTVYYTAIDNAENMADIQSVYFTVYPEGITPSSGPIGVSFNIVGLGFGDYSESNSNVLIGGTAVSISSWTDTGIMGLIPGSLVAGEHAVSVLSGTTTLAEIGTFTVTTPSVYTIDPATGAIGMPFTLTGESLGTYADGHTWVVVGGTTAVITYWTDSLVSAEFPASLSAGTHAVQVLRMYDDTLVESATVYADIEEPVISTMTPTSGSAGSEFLLEGTGFGDYVSSYTRVMAGGLECELTMWVSTAIAGVIPGELEIGTYTVVAVRGEAVSNGIEYTVSGYRAQSARSYSTVSLEFKLGEVYVYPDPAKGGKIPKFHVEVGLADTVRIRVYNVAGEQVHSRTLSGSPQAVGSVYAYEYPWEGRIASGVYYYTMEAERAGKKLKAKGKFAVVR